ncbi:nucleoside-diphosphate-sugar epimerase [Geodermatophilus normandii]|uniref:Nucleoside-diphosphate-sugar epimerase n=2 Tax=Geodermatophilus normandii TaxID=1137989 RepID=A0A317QN78_9ACTN|nr:nucleoside-diphosphate-sugar epimerase [Geodermatophilus normandii]
MLRGGHRRAVAGRVDGMVASPPVVVVTGANGLVGAAVCRALVERSARVRAVVRRAGSAPALHGVTEHVGDFADEDLARAVTRGADAVVTTVHPMGSSREVQHRVGVEGTPVLARAARDAGVARLVHLSTAGVYDRSAGVGDVAEDGALLPEGSGDYPDTKNATDAALAQVGGLTTVLVRPPAILGAGDTSVWNTLRPQEVRDGERRVNPAKSWPWVHVDDLAVLVADVATGAVATADDPERGPVPGSTTPVNVAGEPATWRDYLGTVTDALGVAPEWTDEPVWTGQLRTDRARGWGWAPRVSLAQALDELRRGLTAGR